MTTALSGRLMVLKFNDTTAAFLAVPGQRSTSITISGSAVDVTSKDDTSTVADYSGALIRQLMDQGAPTSFSVDASGVFTDSSLFHTLNKFTQADQAINCQITLPGTSSKGSDVYTGKFKIPSLQYTGAHNNAQEYTIKLESAGTITRTK